MTVLAALTVIVGLALAIRAVLVRRARREAELVREADQWIRAIRYGTHRALTRRPRRRRPAHAKPRRGAIPNSPYRPRHNRVEPSWFEHLWVDALTRAEQALTVEAVLVA